MVDEVQHTAMALEYVNRKGKTYYLHQGKTKTGKPKYFFSMKSKGDLVDTIPDGYEIYENPNAQVFLRKIRRQIVTPAEVEIVQTGVQRYANVAHYIVDVKDERILVYLCDQNIDAFMAIAARGPGGDMTRMQETLLNSTTYSPMMQFVLVDAKARTFGVERWCFRGSVDDWICLDSGDLTALVKKYAPHLGQDSFYELIP